MQSSNLWLWSLQVVEGQAAVEAEPSGQLPAALAESVLPPSERNGHAGFADATPPSAPEVCHGAGGFSCAEC